MSDNEAKLVEELTDRIEKLSRRNKCLLVELSELMTENEALNHIIHALESRLQDSGRDIAHYKKVLADNGIECLEEVG